MARPKPRRVDLPQLGLVSAASLTCCLSLGAFLSAPWSPGAQGRKTRKFLSSASLFRAGSRVFRTLELRLRALDGLGRCTSGSTCGELGAFEGAPDRVCTDHVLPRIHRLRF